MIDRGAIADLKAHILRSLTEVSEEDFIEAMREIAHWATEEANLAEYNEIPETDEE